MSARRRRRRGSGGVAVDRTLTAGDVRPGDRCAFVLNGARVDLDVYEVSHHRLGGVVVVRLGCGPGGYVYTSASIPLLSLERGGTFTFEEPPCSPPLA